MSSCPSCDDGDGGMYKGPKGPTNEEHDCAKVHPDTSHDEWAQLNEEEQLNEYSKRKQVKDCVARVLADPDNTMSSSEAKSYCKGEIGGMAKRPTSGDKPTAAGAKKATGPLKMKSGIAESFILEEFKELNEESTANCISQCAGITDMDQWKVCMRDCKSECTGGACPGGSGDKDKTASRAKSTGKVGIVKPQGKPTAAGAKKATGPLKMKSGMAESVELNEAIERMKNLISYK